MEETLSFYPNEELVTELLSRATFAGIIIKPRGALEEIESKPLIEFDVMWGQKLPETTVKRLLSDILDKLNSSGE